MDLITIDELEVRCRVGVSAAERVRPQRLLVSVHLEQPLGRAARSDALADTIDYFALAQRLLRFGRHRQWKLLESLADELARMILDEFRPRRVTVEVKKFVLPQARHVSVTLTRPR